MPRLSRLDDVLFPVAMRSIYADVGSSREKWPNRIPGKNAVVDTANHRVVGIVSGGYELVTNKEALDAAQLCCREVFPKTQPGEWEVSVVDAPSTGSYTQIDLIHNASVLDFEYVPTGFRPRTPEIFSPFIRVTNSYNGRRALAFRIGFYRKVCSNGMMGPETIIRFRFDHTRSDLGRGIKFEAEHRALAKMQKSFLGYFRVLHDCQINECYFKPLIMKTLLLNVPEKIQNEECVGDKPNPHIS